MQTPNCLDSRMVNENGEDLQCESNHDREDTPPRPHPSTRVFLGLTSQSLDNS